MKHLLKKIESMPWAITREALDGIYKLASREWTSADYEIFHQADQSELQAIVSDLGERRNESKNAFVRGDTGILLLDGPIVPRATAFSAASGLVSVDEMSAEFKAFEADDDIERILMLFDSPGGDVVGIADFAALIRESSKPTAAHIFGMAASAAYWLASQADVVTSTATGVAGSIGVMARPGGADEDVIISNQSPLKNNVETKEGKSNAQRMVDEMADVFITDVAAGRGVRKETVISDFGRGGVLVAGSAQAAGMIDRITTLDALLSSFEKPARAGQPTGGLQMASLKELLQQNPEAAREVDQITAKARAEGEASAKAGITAVLPYLAKNSAYGKKGHALAMKVLEGQATAEMLHVFAAMWDAEAEETISETAQAETEEVGSTPAEAPEAVGDATTEEMTAKQEAQFIADEKRRLYGLEA